MAHGETAAGGPWSHVRMTDRSINADKHIFRVVGDATTCEFEYPDGLVCGRSEDEPVHRFDLPTRSVPEGHGPSHGARFEGDPLPERPVIDEADPPFGSVSPATCSNCEYFCRLSPPDAPVEGQCRIGPPDTHVVLVPAPEMGAVERQILGGVQAPAGPQVMPIAFWPGVQGDAWCGAHSER